MTDVIVIVVLAVILGAAVRYIYKAKKSGAKCIGCPVSACSGSCSGCAHSCGADTGETVSCRCGSKEP